MDTATELFLGESAYSLVSSADAEPRRFADAFNRTQRTIANDFALGPFTIFSSRGTFNQDCKLLRGFVDNYVRKALILRDTANKSCPKQSDERYVILYDLVKRTENPVQLRSEILGLLVAGRDTAASLLSNLWFTLSRRQDVWRRLRAENCSLKGEKPDLGSLKEMKYLQACLNEGIDTLPVLFHTPKA